MMKTKYLAAVSALLLAGCVYSETPYGRYAAIDLPVASRTTINKTVTINAPPGTTVIYQDSQPVHNNPAYPVYPRRVYRYR